MITAFPKKQKQSFLSSSRRTADQRNHKQYEEYKKQHLSNSRRAGSDSPKSEDGGDN
jgi:hypothetical protein